MAVRRRRNSSTDRIKNAGQEWRVKRLAVNNKEKAISQYTRHGEKGIRGKKQNKGRAKSRKSNSVWLAGWEEAMRTCEELQELEKVLSTQRLFFERTQGKSLLRSKGSPEVESFQESLYLLVRKRG